MNTTITTNDLLKKQLKKVTKLDNGYGVLKDIDGRYYYIAPEAIKSPRTEWLTFESQGIIFIYIEEMYG